MSQRILGLSITLVLIASTAIYLYHSTFTNHTTAKMVTQPPIPLKITLSAGSAATYTSNTKLVLHVTLTNTHHAYPVSFLRWSTPLDPLGPAMGLFVVKPLLDSSTTDQEVEPLRTLNLKPNRRVPQSEIFSPADEQIIKINAGESLESDVLLHEPEYIGLIEGQRYVVGVRGTWHGVWLAVRDDVELSVKEGSGLLRGSFEVEGVEIIAS